MMLLGSGPVHLNREELALYTYLKYPPRAPPTQLAKLISRLANGSRGLLFCAAKRCDAFPPNKPAELRARVLRLSSFRRPFSGSCAVLF
jgi:hypothetical protein